MSKNGADGAGDEPLQAARGSPPLAPPRWGAPRARCTRPMPRSILCVCGGPFRWVTDPPTGLSSLFKTSLTRPPIPTKKPPRSQVIRMPFLLLLVSLTATIGVRHRSSNLTYRQTPFPWDKLYTVITKHFFFQSGVLTCFGCENNTGLTRILVTFRDRPMFSHITGKPSPRPFK